jgi:transposase
VDSQTLWDQINVLAHHLSPTYEALGERVMGSKLVFADETPWRLMNGQDAKRWWVWGVSSHEAAYYRLQDSRSTESAATLLGEYRGIVMADGYGVYQALARDGPSFRLVHCWAHVRRKFAELEANHPRESRAMMALIGNLYDVERAMPRWDPNGPEEVQRGVLEERRTLREKASRPIVQEMHQWIVAQHPLPQSDLGKAIRYVVKLWERLTAFLDDPRIPLDNNAAERSLRGVVVGRKNHYGSRSKRGTEVAALFYTLFESAKLCGVEPKHYVLTATLAAIGKPGTVTLPQSLVTLH